MNIFKIIPTKYTYEYISNENIGRDSVEGIALMIRKVGEQGSPVSHLWTVSQQTVLIRYRVYRDDSFERASNTE